MAEWSQDFFSDAYTKFLAKVRAAEDEGYEVVTLGITPARVAEQYELEHLSITFTAVLRKPLPEPAEPQEPVCERLCGCGCRLPYDEALEAAGARSGYLNKDQARAAVPSTCSLHGGKVWPCVYTEDGD